VRRRDRFFARAGNQSGTLHVWISAPLLCDMEWQRMDEAIKLAVKNSPEGVKRLMRLFLVLPIRTYFRYARVRFGKRILWDRVAAHLLWLLKDVKIKTIFGNTISANAKDIVGRYLYYFGVWEPNLTDWIRRRLKPGNVFVDIGANVGYYSLLASTLVGDSGKVVAIEALPEIFEKLRGNLEKNGAHNVRAVNMAVWDRAELITLFTRSEDLPATTTAMHGWADQWNLSQKCQVRAATLPAILSPEEIKGARLIKIDVEGAEWRVVSGLTALLDDGRSDLEIMVEVAPRMLQEQGKSCQDVLDFFGARGFHPYSIENDYSAAAYYSRTSPRQPKRIVYIPAEAEQTDVIFSRVDADVL
jgi:FkbM family methyltransferase